MSGDHHVCVRLDVYDAAALPPVLRHRLEDIERTLRLRADVLSRDQIKDAQRHAGQLERALAAIEAALPSAPPRDTIDHPIPPADCRPNLEA